MGRERLETKGLRQRASWWRGYSFLGAVQLERLCHLREVGSQGRATSGGMWRSCQGEEPDLRDEKKYCACALGVARAHAQARRQVCHFSDAIHLDLGTKSLIDLERT